MSTVWSKDTFNAFLKANFWKIHLKIWFVSFSTTSSLILRVVGEDGRGGVWEDGEGWRVLKHISAVNLKIEKKKKEK